MRKYFKSDITKESSAKLYCWEDDIYRLDLFAPDGKTVLVKEGDKFVSKPGLGKLFATIEFEGLPIKK